MKQKGGIDLKSEHLRPKIIKEQETEWQKNVKHKKSEDYYSKLTSLENEQIVKEQKNREQSHQFAIPGEKIVTGSVTKGMAQSYEDTL